ncbi:hypothetical protein ACSZMN_20965 [Aeromonas veronii]
MEVKNGMASERALEPKDFMSWPIYTTPANIIIDPKGAERVSVVKLLQSNKNDVLVGISFIPDTMATFNKQVKISVGYKVWYLLPGEDDMVGVLTGKRVSEKKYLSQIIPINIFLLI